MTHHACAELLAVLKHERVAVHGFVELLQQEQGLLLENSTDPLLALADQKTARALRLNELAEERRRLLRKFLSELTRTSIQAWFEVNSLECLAIWQEICSLAEQSQQINHINGELIQMKLRHNQQSLAALTQAVSKANLYGPDGQTNFTPGSGRSLGSV